MALTTGTGVPTVMESGNTYIFTESFNQYPSLTFNLKLVYQIPGQAPITLNATQDANKVAFDFTLIATGLAPGRYSYAEYATEIASGERATAKTGVFQVIADLTATLPQTTAQIMLANVEAAIQSLTLRPLISVSVNNISYTRLDLPALISQRTRLQAEVIRERLADDAFRGIETSGRISTRFIATPTGVPFNTKNIGD